MATTTITAFGISFATTEEELETGFRVLDELREKKTSPIDCIKKLAVQFDYTSAKATALYAEWASRNRPIF